SNLDALLEVWSGEPKRQEALRRLWCAAGESLLAMRRRQSCRQAISAVIVVHLSRPVVTQARSLSLAQPPSEMPVSTPEALHAADGERRHLTVLLSDLVGSSQIAGHMDPEDWPDVAAEHQLTATAAVTRLGGHVAKYLGDGL